MSTPRRKGNYGIDAPYAPALMIAGALVGIGLAVFAHIDQMWISVVILLLLAIVYLHTTRRGKFLVWNALLDAMAWRGDERLLDLGCGRGAVLLLAAQHVPRGRAVGIDIWSTKDQSGNAMAVTEQNAVDEGVADRVELHTADMRQLPFESNSFDVIVSSVAIHNISVKADRDRAIEEAWRVLRPGGHLLVADISKGRQYQQRLADLGAMATCRNLGWRMWWGGPWVSTLLIEAQKPIAG